MRASDTLLAELLAQHPLSDDQMLLGRLLAAPPQPSRAGALTLRRPQSPLTFGRPPGRLVLGAGSVLLAVTLSLGGVAPARAERSMPEPVEPAAVAVPAAPALVSPSAAPSAARAALPPMVPSAMVQPFEARAALPPHSAVVSPPPAASVAAPAPGSIADQAAPAAVLPGAPGATLPPAQVSGRAQPKETLAPAPQRPSQGQTTPLRQPAPAAQVVRERVRVITIVYPPPDFSDPFVHIRGTQFDPAVLAQGGPAVPPPPSRRQVTVREVIVTTPASPVRPAQPSSPVQTAPARPGRTYVVAPNDTLTAIAQRFYNNADLWMRIYDANRAVLGNNPNAIPAGVRILIP